MIDIKEATEALKLFEIEINAIGWNDTRVEQFKQAIKILKKALTELERLQKKETPMKVVKGKYNSSSCKICNLDVTHMFHNKYKNYCPHCGQKLDLSVKK